MRRAFSTAALIVLALPAWAGSHPGHSVPQVSIGNFAYGPDTVNVFTTDTVLWFWDGTDRNHSVTADPGQAEAFDSDPGRDTAVEHPRNEAFQHTFNTAGTFTYYCKTHPFMRGKVIVTPSPRAPTDTTDNVAPEVVNVEARPQSFTRRSLLTFVLTEPADLRIDVKKGRKRVRSQDATGVLGENRLRLKAGRLKPGSYSVAVIATDPAGNSSKPGQVRVRVRR